MLNLVDLYPGPYFNEFVFDTGFVEPGGAVTDFEGAVTDLTLTGPQGCLLRSR